MQTDERRLRFAFRFVEMDLNGLRLGDWLNLREDLQAFLRLCPAVVTTAAEEAVLPSTVCHLRGGPAPAQMTNDEIREIQQKVRPWLTPTPTGGGYRSDFIPQKAEFAITATGVHVRGTPEELFLDHVRCLLDKLPPLRVGLCDECGNPFYARKSQRYCSRACSNRVSQRRFRERQEAEVATTA